MIVNGSAILRVRIWHIYCTLYHACQRWSNMTTSACHVDHKHYPIPVHNACLRAICYSILLSVQFMHEHAVERRDTREEDVVAVFHRGTAASSDEIKRRSCVRVHPLCFESIVLSHRMHEESERCIAHDESRCPKGGVRIKFRNPKVNFQDRSGFLADLRR